MMQTMTYEYKVFMFTVEPTTSGDKSFQVKFEAALSDFLLGKGHGWRVRAVNHVGGQATAFAVVMERDKPLDVG